MQRLDAYFADHLADAPDGPDGAWAESNTLATRATCFVLVRIGHIRFALLARDVASVTHAPDPGCRYASGELLVPARYQAMARVARDHDRYVRIAGTRLGIGPCRTGGEVLVEAEDIQARGGGNAEPWIVATVMTPPSLVLEKQALCARLRQAPLLPGPPTASLARSVHRS